ncbi:MAG: hypothetical protein E4G74_02125 [Erysipelotrichales bacterium]|nr:MAG: hypothetical protein E4G74_02125 [Erysipelotrichales bacterium]
MKTDYTKHFETFWNAYPRKTAKATAFKSWQKNVDEDDAFMSKAIVADLEKRTRLKWWPFDTTKIPHAATWISQQRYLDEGWQDEIKTRGQDKAGHVPIDPKYVPRVDTGHKQGHWMSMLNRLGRNYMLRAGGLPDAMIKALVTSKNETHTELLPIVNEEINAAADKPKAKNDMAFMFADTLLTRFDMLTGRQLKSSIINMSRRPQ